MKILVIGDSCKDVFIYGKVERLSPDAPVPILIPTKKFETGGMAANVYENILSLGVDVDIITNTKTITKTRYVEEKTNHQIVRIDSENTRLSRIKNLKEINFSNYTAIIISDYNKGFLDYEDIEYICNSHDTVFVDSKKIINKYFSKAKFLKINEVEYNTNLVSGQNFDNFFEQLIVTLGSIGTRYKEEIFPVDKVEIKDSSGAGDTFISGLVVEYCRTKDIKKAIQFGNKCATIVVQQKGVSKVGNYINILNEK